VIFILVVAVALGTIYHLKTFFTLSPPVSPLEKGSTGKIKILVYRCESSKFAGG